MASLTSFLPQIAPALGLTTAALYERQRSLVRLGLLPTPQGRGRGSGAEATPDTVALILIAVMLSDNLSDIDERVKHLAAAPILVEKRKEQNCPWTGKSKFKDALSFLLSEDAPNPRLGHSAVTVSRTEPNASITFVWRRRRPGVSRFGRFDWAKSQQRLIVEAKLSNETLQTIRKSLKQADIDISADVK